MHFYIHPIQSLPLKGLVEYILFNYTDKEATQGEVISYANTNICLGIVREKQLVERNNGYKGLRKADSVNAYLSGMYLRPHHFEWTGRLDEICIDFTPLGYCHYFKSALPTYLFDTHILNRFFGSNTQHFFESIFEESNFQVRGILIEQFLLAKLPLFENDFLKHSLNLIHKYQGNIAIKELNKLLNCSEKKLLRTFKTYLTISPKEYLRIVKFRYALKLLHYSTDKSLTQIGYESGYYDQSHFIKEFQYFTNETPRSLQPSISNVEEQVLISVK